MHLECCQFFSLTITKVELEMERERERKVQVPILSSVTHLHGGICTRGAVQRFTFINDWRQWNIKLSATGSSGNLCVILLNLSVEQSEILSCLSLANPALKRT